MRLPQWYSLTKLDVVIVARVERLRNSACCCPGKRSVDCGKLVVLVFANVSIFIIGASSCCSPRCRALNLRASERPLQKPVGRVWTFHPISHCPVAGLALVPHPQQARMPCVDEVDDANIGFRCVLTVQSSSVLLEGTFP